MGLLSLQLEDYDAAETYLKRVLELNYKDPDAVRYYLGQLNEDRNHYAQAAEWYGLIAPGENYLPAQIKIATMLARQNRLDEARKHLQGVTAENSQQRVQLILADEVKLLEAKAVGAIGREAGPRRDSRSRDGDPGRGLRDGAAA